MSVIPPLKAVDEIITYIYHGLLEPDPWQLFMRCLRQRLDCDTAVITLKPARAGIKAITVWDRRSPLADIAAKTAMEEQARLAHLDPLSNALRQSGDIYTLDEVITRSEFMNSEFYLNILKPNDVEYMLGMYISEPNGWKCRVGIMNGSSRNNFGEVEKCYLKSLRPHLEHALQVHSLLKRSELEKEIYEEALNRLTIGSIILDGHNKIIDRRIQPRSA